MAAADPPPEPPPPPPPVRIWAHRFRTLAWLWFFPSIGAVGILLGARKDGARSGGITLESVRLEEWVALGLLALHGLWWVLARRQERTETPRQLEPFTDEPPPA